MKEKPKLVCQKCKKENSPDKKSNENWEVYNTTCEKCGGEMKLEF